MLQINKEFLSQVKYLKHNHISILLYLYAWTLSKNSPKLVSLDNSGLFYFYIYLNKIADDLFLTRRQVQDALFRLENKDKSIQTTLQPFIISKQVKKENKLYIALNPVMIPFILTDKNMISILQKRLTGNSYNITKINKRDNEMLFDVEERKGYSLEAEMLVKKLIRKNKTVFNTQLPEDRKDGKKTGIFINSCKMVQDIYNGTFGTSRNNYNFCEEFLESKQFDISGWRETLQSVKGNWNEVQKLLFKSISNFKLMFNNDRMPFNKSHLQSNFSLWLYDPYTNAGKGQSQFIQSLKEPNETGKQLSENKADRIFETLSEKGKESANKLYDLAPKSTPAGTFFENVSKMIDWAKEVFQIDNNAKYWFSTPGELPGLFADYCEQNNITVNCATIDIEKAVNCQGPWVWFVEDAIKEHSLNSNLSSCANADDLFDCYNYKDNDVDFIF